MTAHGASTEKHARGTLGELLHQQALQKPDAPALLSNDEKLSFRDLDESSTRLARWLVDQGLKPGDRVAIH
jgi:non-ribosomal peptide synthetase component F